MKKQKMLFVLLALFSLNLTGVSNTVNYSGVKVMDKINAEEQINTSDLLNEDYVNWMGRTYYDAKSKATFFNFSASGFEVKFYGTKLEANLVATNTDNIQHRPFISVLVDGETNPDYALVIKLTKAEETVTLSEGLLEGEHTLKVYKRSECSSSHVGVKNVTTDGHLMKVDKDDSSLKIEIFGDSITCGYQVEGTTYEGDFTTRLENSLKTYGYYAARELNAKLSLISAGGFPVYQSEYTQGYQVKTIPDMFSMADFDANTTTSSYNSWDNSKYIPDVVVIYLGANDGSSYAKTTDYSDFIASFKAKYSSFLDTIYKTYGDDTKVIMTSNLIPNAEVIENAINDVYDAYKDKAYRLVFNVEYKNQVLPGQGHPNINMQKEAGKQLASKIKEITNAN